MDRIKALFKRYPGLYQALFYIFAAQPHNASGFSFVRGLPKDAKIVNVGSGPKRLRADVINTDLFPFEGVTVVADATQLPFESDSIDAVVCDNVLEHTKEPSRVVAELLRVLKPGGLAYIAVPFIIQYHSSPDDYYRWTMQGLRELLKDFNEVELKIQYGPSTAFIFIFAEWLAILLSFNIKFLYITVLCVATVILSPLKLLDYLLVHYSSAKHMPLSIYFIGSKK